MIRILSYNVHFGKKLDEILLWFTTIPAPDIVSFQEFPRDRIADIRALLPTYRAAFAPSLYVRKKIFGILVLWSPALRFRSKKTMNLGVSRVEKAILRTHIPRTALLVRFSSFVLVVPHLVSLATNKTRLTQVRQLISAAASTKKPVAIIGDFNIPSLLAKNVLVQFMAAYGYATHNRRHVTYRLGYQVDYAFGKNLTIDNFSVVRLRLSDHYPVEVGIAL